MNGAKKITIRMNTWSGIFLAGFMSFLLLLIISDSQAVFANAGVTANELENEKLEYSDVRNIILQRTVRGVVTDASTGETLPGVNIAVSGTTIGTSTNANGEYELSNIPADAETLVYSFLGFQQQQILIEGRSVINVELEASVAQLDDIVVIGYGDRERRDLTGSISTVTSDHIGRVGVTSPELALQGRTPGVFVSGTGGNPNARPNIQIRGLGTFGRANQPLYVIDGVPMTEFGSGYESEDARSRDIRGTMNVMNTIDPNDIESISVLKDAAASSIYGVRAANGVILITTKTGQRGSPVISVNAERGFQTITRSADVLNVQQYTQLYQEAYASGGTPDQLPSVFNPSSPDYLGNSAFVDWQDTFTNDNAVTEDYSVNLSGGSESITYYVSTSYSNTENPMVSASGNERYSFTSNIRSSISERMRMGANYRFSQSKSSTEGRTPDFSYWEAPPWQPIFDENGPNGFASTGDNHQRFGPNTMRNVMGEQSTKDAFRSIGRNLFSGYFEVDPVSNLSIRATANIDIYDNRKPFFTDAAYTSFNNATMDISPGSVGTFRERNLTNRNITGDLRANYVNNFGAHSVEVLFNLSRQKYSAEFMQTSTRFVAGHDPSQWVARGTIEQTDLSHDKHEDALIGILGRFSYNFDSRYYLDVSVRRDGTSRFAPEYRWGTFPSVAAAWRISSESFMDDVLFINDLKLRAGWGKLGNQETQRFAFLSTVGEEPGYGLGMTPENPAGRPVQGARIPDFPTADLSWETVTTSNIGVDALLMNNRLNLTVEYYRRDTNGILQSASLPPSVGNEFSPIFNLAEVRNQGIELEAGFSDLIGSVQYKVSGNFTTVNNKVISLYEGNPLGGTGGRIEEGQPMNFFWGYKVDRILRDQAEVDAWENQYNWPGISLSPGDIVYQDLGGPDEVPDGTINEDDRVNLGNPIPGYYYGLNVDLFYKGFDFTVFFQGIGDIQKINSVRQTGEAMNSTGNNQLTSTLDRWTPENRNGSLPRAVREGNDNNAVFSDRWVEDADYFRLRNLQLGYTLQPDFLSEIGLNPQSSYRLYVRANNLFTATGWSGIDPENDFIPPARTFVIGVQLSFR